MATRDLIFKVVCDTSDIDRLHALLKECNKDAKALGLSKRQVRCVLERMSAEATSKVNE